MTARTLKISADLALPLDAQTRTFVLYGGKGKGKTNCAAVICEEFARAGLRFAVIDPLDVFWGLRHGITKDVEGLNVVILGGTRGDLPITPDAGAVVADFVADEEANVIIAMRKASGEMWTSGERIRFMRDYARRLFQRQGEHRRPIFQFIDEAGRFVPQVAAKNDFDISDCIGAVEELVEWGRNFGIGVGLITQRSARMNKSVSELAECMIAFNTVGPRSIAAIVDWFGEHIPRERQKDLIERLRTLPVGRALIVSPEWLTFEGEAQIRERTTFDSSATPKAGEKPRRPGKAKPIDLAAYAAKMQATTEKAKAEDPRELTKRIRELERDLAKAHGAPAKAAASIRVEVEDEAARAAVRDLTRAIGQVSHGFETFLQALARSSDALENAKGKFREIMASLQDTAAKAPIWTGKARPRSPLVDDATRAIAAAARGTPPAPLNGRTGERTRVVEGNGEMTKGHQRILDGLAEMAALGIRRPTRKALRIFAAYDVTGGKPGMTLADLISRGYVATPAPGVLELTDSGHVAADVAGLPTSLEDLQARVLAKLNDGQRRILTHLIAIHPASITRHELKAAISYDVTGGKPGMNLAALITMGAVDVPAPGSVIASDLLFPEGLA